MPHRSRLRAGNDLARPSPQLVEAPGQRFQLNSCGAVWNAATYRGDKVARFVLVHGAFAGAWIWGPLSDRLKAAGNSVEVFDLPGSGEDPTPASGATLD